MKVNDCSNYGLGMLITQEDFDLLRMLQEGDKLQNIAFFSTWTVNKLDGVVRHKTNSLKHAFPGDRKGEIEIELKLNDIEEIEIRVKDDGVGLPTDFDLRKSGSYGLQSVISLTEHQLQGNLDFITEKGTEFRIRFKEAGYKERV